MTDARESIHMTVRMSGQVTLVRGYADAVRNMFVMANLALVMPADMARDFRVMAQKRNRMIILFAHRPSSGEKLRQWLPSLRLPSLVDVHSRVPFYSKLGWRTSQGKALPEMSSFANHPAATLHQEFKQTPIQCFMCMVNDAPLICSTCRHVSYCSNACAEQHWNDSHKVQCERTLFGERET